VLKVDNAAVRKTQIERLERLRAERDEAVIQVTGRMGDRVEWSIGEALIGVNYRVSGKQAAYVYAMAEKRAKDRVILKLTGIHGLVYSEDEMSGEDRAPAPIASAPTPISSYRAKQLLKTEVLLEEIDGAKTDKRCDELEALFNTELAFLPPNWIKQFMDRIAQRREELGKPHPAVAANESLDRQFRDTVGGAA